MEAKVTLQDWSLISSTEKLSLQDLVSEEYDPNINEGLLFFWGENSFLNVHYEIHKCIGTSILDENDQIVTFEGDRSLEGCIVFTSQ